MRFALIGQPNCGKSTLFNQVAGYKAHTGNFSGTTVTYTESKVRVAGQVIELVDLPGTYSLNGTNPAERETLNYLRSRRVDVIINLVDATHLTQGLGLTLELLEFGNPVVLAINMMDEAARLGITLNGTRLQEIFGVPVLPLVASKGRGVRHLFNIALDASKSSDSTIPTTYSSELEAVVNPNSAVRMLTERRLRAEEIAAEVIVYGERHISIRDRLDDLLLHPFWGYICLMVILLVFFEIIYGIGNALEQPLLAWFGSLQSALEMAIGSESLQAQIVIGLLQGVAGGIAIVLPYLVPFLLGLGFLEDIGYMPRVAFLMDALMHRIGLHGKAIVPFILGYGCNVPAVMTTRMLEERRDRFLAAALATMVPCAARLAVVFGLVAFYLGPLSGLGIYIFNIFVIAITGRILSSFLPEDTPGLILEMPVYRLPTLRNVLYKSWFRVREFIVEAWPILILGSIVLSLMIYFRFSDVINLVVRPLTWILGLPFGTGVPLVFGILRKELSLIMLQQALGVDDFSAVLGTIQMVTFTVFVVFYIPCLATLAVLRRELGTRDMLVISAITVVIATLAALLARGISQLVQVT